MFYIESEVNQQRFGAMGWFDHPESYNAYTSLEKASKEAVELVTMFGCEHSLVYDSDTGEILREYVKTRWMNGDNRVAKRVW